MFIKKRFLFFLASFAILLILPHQFFAQTQSAAELMDIKLERPGDRLFVQIEITGAYSFRSFFLKNPNRMVIDLNQVLYFHSTDRIEVSDFGVLNIRVGKNQPRITRIVFDLEEPAPLYKIGKINEGLLVSFQWEQEKEEIPTPKIEKKIQPPKLPKKPAQEEPIKKEEETKEEVEEGPVKIPEEISEKLLKTIARITQKEKSIKFGLGVHSGTYFSFDSHIRDNYSRSPQLGGEVALIIPFKHSNGLGISGSYFHITKDGINPEEYIRLKMTPLSLSLLYMSIHEKVIPYIGGGVDYINYSENSPLAYEEQLISRKALGANLQLGIYIRSGSFLYSKIYATFHFSRLKEDLLDINMGGVEGGFSLCFFFRVPSKKSRTSP